MKLLSMVIIGALLGSGVSAHAAIEAFQLHPGGGFYQEEQWEPGKLRRWMDNNARLLVCNQGESTSADLRFTAESFRISRNLSVLFNNEQILDVSIPASAALFVVAKRLWIAQGCSTIVFSASPGPDRPSQYLNTRDTRDLSIAFGPFSMIDARLPEAQREQTGAFPVADHRIPGLSPVENLAGNLRRQGRLLEADYAYKKALNSGQVQPSTYLWAGLTRIGLDRTNEAIPLFQQCAKLDSRLPRAGLIRRACSLLATYVRRSDLLRDAASDPGRNFRKRGEIYKAVALYRSILAHDPQNLTASYWLGLLTALAERPREARPLLAVVARRSPEDSPDGQMARELEAYLRGL
jgi:hypothetical protein